MKNDMKTNSSYYKTRAVWSSHSKSSKEEKKKEKKKKTKQSMNCKDFQEHILLMHRLSGHVISN